MKLDKIEDVKDADCIIVAVAHDEFKEMGAIKTMFKDCVDDEKVLIDVKGIYSVEELKTTGMQWWRL